MTEDETRAETVSLLQDLGLKEYEARCFLALTQLSTGTAKEISELSEVPRTRVYDAIRVLEAQSLVEVQHSSPQQFRAVSVDEATATLSQKYERRIETLQSHLERIERTEETGDDVDRMQEVWSLTGVEGIQSRTLDLLEDADSEILLLVVEESLLDGAVFGRLEAAVDRGVDVIVGGQSETVVDRVESEVSDVETFVTGLDWLSGPDREDEVAISRLLLVDRSRVLVSSFYPDDGRAEKREQAVFADGLGNGVVVLIRRLISAGMIPGTRSDS